MNRRQLFATPMLGMAALQAATDKPTLPDAALRISDPEKYWLRVRKEQFFLPDWRAFLNNGSLGVIPRPVYAAVTEYMERAAGLMMEEYPRWGYETLDAERTEMAEFVGCKKDELAFTHNATEALNMIAEGIDLKPGDEVLMTNEEHPSGRSPWYRRAKRDGITVREVKIPLPPKSSAELAEVMISAIGPKTRVISFSGILTAVGVIMPVREICTAARAKGIITVVDGAHMNGQIPLRLADFNCDYYAGSPHKWMFAPAGCGLLYIREENLEKLWPTIVTGNWDNPELKAARFMQVGTNNRAIFMGMMAGLKFLKELGPENVYARIHDLARRTYAMAKERPYLSLYSSEDHTLYGSLVTIGFQGRDLKPLWERLKQKRIWTTQGERLRLSPHVHTRPQDLEIFFSTLDEVLGRRA